MKKRYLTTILTLLLCVVFAFVGCGEGNSGGTLPKPSELRLANAPIQFEAGEAFSSEGLQVFVKLDDGSEYLADASEYEVDSSAFDNTTAGQYTITVSLKGTELSRTYRVTVTGSLPDGPDNPDDPDNPDNPDDPPVIDDNPVENQLNVWIIAGQSNAAGYSSINTVPRNPDIGTDLYRNMLRDLDSRNSDGYDVLYYGVVDRSAILGIPSNVTIKNVKMGLGRDTGYIGPELGMANILADQSTPSALIKFAAGATYLADVQCQYDVSKNYGTWASPSVTAKYVSQGVTPGQYNGHMYEGLLKTIEYAFAAFEAQGYTPVIKGYTWFQGEADAFPSVLATQYRNNLEMFINDLRTAVAELTGDEAAATRPFVISKICPTGDYGSKVNMEYVRAAEDALASSMENVVAVETEDLLLTNNRGTDAYHFNPLDMYELGQRIAREALGALSAS